MTYLNSITMDLKISKEINFFLVNIVLGNSLVKMCTTLILNLAFMRVQKTTYTTINGLVVIFYAV